MRICRARLTRMLVLVLLSVTFLDTYSFANTPSREVIRVGFFESTGMFEGASDNADKRGYCYDYMMQIASYTGWNYEFCYGSFADLYVKLKNGEIDILPYTNYNAQRGKEVLFSNNPLAEEEYFLAVKKGSRAADNIQALNGGVISTMKDADYNTLLFDFLKKNRLNNVQVNYFHYVDEIWNELREGRADATIFTSNSFSRDDWDCICSFGKKPTYICVAKGRSDLLEKLNEAEDIIEKESPGYKGSLFGFYFSDNPVRKALTAEEREWIEAHPVLHVGCLYNDAPNIYSYDEKTHAATGLAVDVINGIIQRLNLGISADFTCYTSISEIMDALDSGEIDVLFPFYQSPYIAQRNNLYISNVVRSANMAVAYKKGTSYSDAFEKIAASTIRLGAFYVNDYFPESEIVKSGTVADAVGKVRNGTATGAIAQISSVRTAAEDFNDITVTLLPEGCGTCFATRPSNFPLLRVLNRGLIYFSDAEIVAITSKYSPTPRVTLKAFIKTHKAVGIMALLVLVSLVVLAAFLIKLHLLNIKADAANKSKSAFLFNMSHDLRTPMNAITGFTTMARKYADDKEMLNDYLNKIDVSGKQLMNLINQVLEMARIEAGRIEFTVHPVNVKDRFDTMVVILAEQTATRGLEFRHSLKDIIHYNVLADDTRMEQITLNIVGNAIKYTPEGGRIDFSLREIPSRKPGYASYVFTVADTGIGMSEEFINNLYEPFAREKSSTVSKIPGTGLGMSIVKSLVDLAGGEIEVKSELGKGTRFDITIDLKINDKADKIDEETDKDKNLSFSFKGKRALLVEDNEMNREIAKFILQDKGVVVEDAEDGDLAVEKIRDLAEEGNFNHYDFILMDVQMPTMDGYEATGRIRDILDPLGIHIPIIAISANAFEEDRQKSMEAGMDDHVAKPIDIDKLWETLAKFL